MYINEEKSQMHYSKVIASRMYHCESSSLHLHTDIYKLSPSTLGQVPFGYYVIILDPENLSADISQALILHNVSIIYRQTHWRGPNHRPIH